VGSIIITLSQIIRRVCQWKNFENWLIIGEDMDKSTVAHYFWPTLYISVWATSINIAHCTKELLPVCDQEMAKILQHDQVYSFLHVPVQSGSDSVLMDMKREYCIADFRHVVDFLRQKLDFTFVVHCSNCVFCSALNVTTCGKQFVKIVIWLTFVVF